MADFETSLVVSGLLDTQGLLTRFDWQPLAEGVFIATFYETGAHGSRAALLHYLPGASVASHQHSGFEHILILQGSQRDGDAVYRQGDLVIHKPGTHHTLHSPEGCIALGIWERPVVFVG